MILDLTASTCAYCDKPLSDSKALTVIPEETTEPIRFHMWCAMKRLGENGGS